MAKGSKRPVFEKITLVCATDMPRDVLQYCVEQEISTHYQDSIAVIADNGNPFAEWLKENGYKFKKTNANEGDYIAIIAT